MQLSIGVRWALRYTVAMSVTLTLFALVVQAQVERRINREAHLVTEIQARELVDSLRTQLQEHPREEVMRWLAARAHRTVREAEPDLGLGIEYLDEQGRSLVAAGSLAGAGVPVPLDLREGGRRESLRAVNLGGEHAHLLSVMAAPGGFVQVAIDTRRYADNVDHVRDVLLISFPVMLVLTGLLGWFLARGSLRPIARMTRTARRISGSNLRESIPTTGSNDELDALARTLNSMMERIREGVARMHRFNANAAHEIRTPLNRICGQIDAALQAPASEEEYRRVLENVLQQAHQLAGGVNALLRLSRSEAGLDPGHVEKVAVAPLLETLVEFFEPLASERGIALAPGRFPDAVVEGDASWLRQMFSNLVDNAVKYCRPGDRVRIEAELRKDEVWVRVADTGPGIPPEERTSIFDRFQRGHRHRAQPGFGLGLPLAQEIARAHGGGIEAASGDAGTTFTVRLPRAEAASRGAGR